MVCKYCNKEMLLDDVDYNFKGNKDNYWICHDCNSSCIEEIRFNKSINEHWHKEEPFNEDTNPFSKKNWENTLREIFGGKN